MEGNIAPRESFSGNCLGHRAFRTNTRRNSTLFHSLSSKGIKLMKKKTLAFQFYLGNNAVFFFHIYFYIFFSFLFTCCYVMKKRESVCKCLYVICCYQLCFLLGWLDVFSTVLLQVLLFVVTLWSNQVSNFLSLSLLSLFLYMQCR